MNVLLYFTAGSLLPQVTKKDNVFNSRVIQYTVYSSCITIHFFAEFVPEMARKRR